MRFLGYLWVLPVKVVGLLLALVARMSGGSVRFREGIVEACGGWPGRLLRGGVSGLAGPL
jgi:hypothetical protein